MWLVKHHTCVQTVWFCVAPYSKRRVKLIHTLDVYTYILEPDRQIDVLHLVQWAYTVTDDCPALRRLKWELGACAVYMESNKVKHASPIGARVS